MQPMKCSNIGASRERGRERTRGAIKPVAIRTNAKPRLEARAEVRTLHLPRLLPLEKIVADKPRAIQRLIEQCAVDEFVILR